MSRRNSLRLPPQPAPIPIPPSLLQSPYLNAPIFSRQISTQQMPTEEDEQWLQDTVPISPSKSTGAGEDNAKSNSSDRRGSIVQPPSQHVSSPYHGLHRRTASAHITPIVNAPFHSPSSSSPTTSTRGRNSSSSTHRFLAHSLAPPPPDPHIGYAGRPVKLNQAHSNPSISSLGGSSADQAYLARVGPTP